MEGISLETYQFEYDVFLAEEEMISSLTNLSYVCENDSAGLTYIHENFIETLNKYLGKVVSGISNAWQKFQEAIGTLELNISADQIANANPDFDVNNFVGLDNEKFSSIKLKKLDKAYYDEAKEHLKSEEEFGKFAFPNIYNLEGKNLKEKFKKYVYQDPKTIHIDRDQMQTMYKFCTTDYKVYSTSISEDIKTVNQSNENIKNIVNEISTNESSFNIKKCIDYFLEADDNPQPAGTNVAKPNPSNNPDGKTDNNDKLGKMSFDDKKDNQKEQNTNTELVKEIKNYMSVMCAILSSKMAVLLEKRNTYIKIIRHCFPKATKKTKEENNNEESQEIKTHQVEV